MALSDAALRAMLGKEYEKVQVKTDRDGLSARVSCKGKAMRLRGELEKNRNPRLLKRRAREDAVSALTVEEVIRTWIEKYGVENKPEHHDVLRSFEIHVFPCLGRVPHEDAPIHMWLNVLEPLALAKPSIVIRLLTNAKQAHNWAVRRQLTKTTPLSDLRLADLGITLTPRERVVSADEIVTIFRAMEASRLARKFQLLVKLCLLFGCRVGEQANAEKSHFDFEKKLWSIPPTHHKTGKRTRKPLLRPVIPEAEEMLKELFAQSPHSRFAMANIKRDAPQARSSLIDIPPRIRQSARRHLSTEMEHWTLHDLCRTARINFSDLTEPHVAEIMLGHKLPGVWQVYDRYEYIEEQRRAYSLWWARVTGWISGEGTG